MVVVGAAHAGPATAVHAASEGLSVIVFDARAYGGQAGESARIENYLGFPTGISGRALTGRAFAQAPKFGAEMAIPIEVTGLACYRRPIFPRLQEFEGRGNWYRASQTEARMCPQEEIALVG